MHKKPGAITCILKNELFFLSKGIRKKSLINLLYNDWQFKKHLWCCKFYNNVSAELVDMFCMYVHLNLQNFLCNSCRSLIYFVLDRAIKDLSVNMCTVWQCEIDGGFCLKPSEGNSYFDIATNV